jgi:hypothetical protein
MPVIGQQLGVDEQQVRVRLPGGGELVGLTREGDELVYLEESALDHLPLDVERAGEGDQVKFLVLGREGEEWTCVGSRRDDVDSFLIRREHDRLPIALVPSWMVEFVGEGEGDVDG